MLRGSLRSSSPAVSYRLSLLVSLGALLFGFAVNVALEALGAFGDGRGTLLRSVLLFLTVYFALTILHAMRAVKTGGPPVAEAAAAYLVDTSVFIDGRIIDIVRTGLIDGPLLAASFVLDELQQLADGGDKARRTRGMRGLDVLKQLRAELGDRLQVLPPEQSKGFATAVDEHLIRLAVSRQAKLLTVDAPLQKRAQAQGVTVVNWNDLAAALKPPCAPGDRLTLRIVRQGQQPGQGVGYLEDGTMVVVEGAAELVDRETLLTVNSVTQTSAGRMVFGRREG